MFDITHYAMLSDNLKTSQWTLNKYKTEIVIANMCF